MQSLGDRVKTEANGAAYSYGLLLNDAVQQIAPGKCLPLNAVAYLRSVVGVSKAARFGWRPVKEAGCIQCHCSGITPLLHMIEPFLDEPPLFSERKRVGG